ncbi:receptor-type tyrosine-protein phosphatase delta-like [Argopecten irradians]|uniref:receptor-type tyrosine-protein phosphatase delta-like n=1 Tax=Argopecten irradians TaxID=31199 RepID=UPI00371AE177
MPTISAINGATVPDVNQGSSAILKCTFRGFPKTVNWYQDDTLLPYSYRRAFFQHPDVESHELRAELHILLVRESDLGKYNCEGWNQFGAHNGTVYLKKQYTTPPTPTITPTQAKNVSVCCSQRNVTGVCMDLCTYRVDLSLVVQNPVKYASCVNFFEDYVTCATDGKDHTKCCKDNGVSPFCQDFCGNVVPDIDDPRIYECVDQVNPILNCIEEGLEKIPSQPLNVIALLKGHVIEVNWDQPADVNTIDVYQIWYSNNNNNMVKHESVSNTTHTWTLNYPEVTTYSFWVIAKNKAGQSLPGYARNLTVRGIPPSEPLDLKGTLKDYNDIMLTWMPPQKGSVQGYTVYFSSDGTSYMQTTTENRLILTDLNYGSLYTIKVAANSAYGKGSNSTTIQLKTQNAVKSRSLATQGANVGAIVGVVILILVLVAAAVIGFIFIRKRGMLKRFSRPDSVAFENPQYGVPGSNGQVQISGLPEHSPDAGEQTNFDYCPLKEDMDIDPYSTAATLNVDQVGLTMNH